MPIPRVWFSAVALQGRIYAVGGYSGSTLSRVDAYDPATDTWSPRRAMPTARALAVTAAVDGKIYAIGGFQITSPYTADYSVANEMYDPATDTWTAKASFPFPQPVNSYIANAFYAGTAVQGKIYVVSFQPGVTACYVYDPATDSWDTSLAAVPFTYTNYSTAALGGKLYAAAIGMLPWSGGQFTNGAPFGEYDPAADTWIIRQPTLSARRAFALGSFGSLVYAVGGLEIDHLEPEETFLRPVATVESFDPATARWSARTAMPTSRFSPAVVSLNGRLYVLGGALTSSNSSPVVPLATVEAAELASGGCVPDPTTLCIDGQAGDAQFEVTVSYATTQGGGLSGNATAVPLASLGIDRGGIFWFFDAGNPEMLVKVLDGCAANGHFWVFSSAGTNVGFTLRVRDTSTGRVFTRTNPDLRAAPPVQDTLALECGG